MSAAKVALIALVVCLAAAVAGFFYGKHQGALAESAKRDGKAVADLTQLITSHQGLIGQANRASLALRAVVAARLEADNKFLQEFKDALKPTADSRAGCVFPPDVMRQLNAARDRAAKAAASGIAGGVPAAAPGSTGDW